MELSDPFIPMGVINLTPDSFSDGGRFSDANEVLRQIADMKSVGCKLFDFGAESTAPFNPPVSLNEELSRFKQLLYPTLERLEADNACISIDTYKVQVMDSLMESGVLDNRQIVFNDVSGSLDSELEELLLKYPNLNYVYSHNLIPMRSKTQEHMEHLAPFYGQDLLRHLEDYFEQAICWFQSKGIQNKIWFDPGFGFSKDFQQNLDLIQGLPTVVNQSGPGQTWLFGISKKSFLRELVAKGCEKDVQFHRAEQAHAAILAHWINTIEPQNQVIIRLHDVSLFSSVKWCKFLFKS